MNRNKHWYEFDLSGYSTGGRLYVDTCAGTGTMNTVLGIGLTCPLAYNTWGCVQTNDNANVITADCPSTRYLTMSNATLVTNSTRYFVMVTLPLSTTRCAHQQ